MGVKIFVSNWILSLVFDTPMIQSLAFYLAFEGAKNIHVHKVLIWGFGGCWRFLTGDWHLDLDLDMATDLFTTIFQILALYLDFEGAKNIHIFKS